MNPRDQAAFDKRVAEWTHKWDILVISDDFQHIKDDNAKKTLTLLADYAGMHKVLPGAVIRFLAGHPNRRYTKEVISAINDFKTKSISESAEHFELENSSTQSILRDVKSRINEDLVPHGDLQALMAVIKNKTGATYGKCDGLDLPFISSR